ncbi:hypothetical protein BJF86_04035 [Serinicoccus sp. CNJ-927]|uniref:YlxR family protein n=1 Tax=Serinicoccus sp. CNJ-927 TaxID=1904970 RepID=UPI0009631354|nr:YlxR family protein [Serinicoccus sp. CNJ-927]OLT40992.1 hypothetical protein BJF86_04035 [Serinicoccus sp. CNJ-927]
MEGRSGAVSTSQVGHSPVRTCVGCRTRCEQTALLRFVARQDAPARWRVVLDVRRRLPGRGAYVHPAPECVESAITRRALLRALRLPASGEVDLGDVRRHAQQHG